MVNITGESSSSPNDYALLNAVLLGLKVTLIFITIGGNLLTICAICRFKTLRYPSNVMIAILAVSDLLMGSVYTPMILVRANLPFLLTNRTFCLPFLFTAQSLVLASVVYQSALSIERFYAVQFPYHYHSKVTIKHNLVWSSIAVPGIILLNIPVLCGIDVQSENINCYSPTLLSSAYSTLFVSSLLLVQLVGILAFIRVLAAEFSFRRRDRNLQMSDTQKQDSVQSTIIVLAYGISLCFYMPHTFYYFWGTISKQKVNPVTLGLLQLLDMCSSAVNCFIYGFKNSKFREAFKYLLGFKSSRVETS